MRKRRGRICYPYMCPYCDELSFPSINKSPLILHNRSITVWVCPNNHEFYTYERVCTHQEWASNVYEGTEQCWRKDADKWLKMLKRRKFGKDDYSEQKD